MISTTLHLLLSHPPIQFLLRTTTPPTLSVCVAEELLEAFLAAIECGVSAEAAAASVASGMLPMLYRPMLLRVLARETPRSSGHSLR